MNRKKCVICHKKINFNKDKYVKLTDFEGKKATAHCFYHLSCWQSAFKIEQDKLIDKANQYIEKIMEVAP
jgi:hypothetical protein